MSDIVNLSTAFAGKPEVFGTALVPMNSTDLAVYGAGVPVTHWFVVGYDMGDLSTVACFAADSTGLGDIESADFEIAGIRWNADGEFRRVLFQICTDGLDELIKG